MTGAHKLVRRYLLQNVAVLATDIGLDDALSGYDIVKIELSERVGVVV